MAPRAFASSKARTSGRFRPLFVIATKSVRASAPRAVICMSSPSVEASAAMPIRSRCAAKLSATLAEAPTPQITMRPARLSISAAVWMAEKSSCSAAIWSVSMLREKISRETASGEPSFRFSKMILELCRPYLASMSFSSLNPEYPSALQNLTMLDSAISSSRPSWWMLEARTWSGCSRTLSAILRNTLEKPE